MACLQRIIGFKNMEMELQRSRGKACLAFIYIDIGRKCSLTYWGANGKLATRHEMTCISLWQILHVAFPSRLMPALMIMLLIYTATYKYLFGGPLTPYNVTDAANCRDIWWKNLLMISNFTTLSSTASQSSFSLRDRRDSKLSVGQCQ